MAHFFPVLIALTVWTAAVPAPAVETDTHPKHTCLAQSETREEIHERHLLEPFAALKTASAQLKAEALKIRLCRTGDEFVYEIALLHRDGRYVHVVMNAATGKLIETRRAREATPKN